jgi:hypothetical protein
MTPVFHWLSGGESRFGLEPLPGVRQRHADSAHGYYSAPHANFTRFDTAAGE